MKCYVENHRDFVKKNFTAEDIARTNSKFLKKENKENVKTTRAS